MEYIWEFTYFIYNYKRLGRHKANAYLQTFITSTYEYEFSSYNYAF